MITILFPFSYRGHSCINIVLIIYYLEFLSSLILSRLLYLTVVNSLLG